MFDGIETGDKRGELRTISCHCLWDGVLQQLSEYAVLRNNCALRRAQGLEFLRDGAELVAERSQPLRLDGQRGC